MPSQARENLNIRLGDVDQILNAHSAITKFKNAEAAAQRLSGDLNQAVNVFNALVTDPGRGKPKEVDALNRAAYVLLTSHLQGFVDDLHKEIGLLIIGNNASSPGDVIKMLGNNRANPHVEVISRIFSSLGLYDVMDQLSWRNCNNKSVKRRLTTALQTRNKIAHGAREGITKANVTQLKDFVILFADGLDAEVRRKAQIILGRHPW
ncbi:HEPN domain-containing protein [Halomonas tibetensis]|uniref:HEPN domain-containing protein n=1 Tax=Halomonas tibetensis TaxID=2259590 RepID=A0ABV7B6W7_9GAMM